MYERLIYRFPDAIEYEERHSAKYGAPGAKRKKRKKATPEDVERVNQWAREKRCRHKLRQYFKPNDIYVTLTYEKDKRPADMDGAKADFKKFITALRREYRRAAVDLRWIRNIEVGTRNGWHVHMVIPDIPGIHAILSKAWTKGKAIMQALYTAGRFAKLAAYLTKTPKTDTRLREASYSASRNMPLKDPEKKVLMRKTWGPIRPPAGWYVDRESIREGINPVTGYPYRHYAILRC